MIRTLLFILCALMCAFSLSRGGRIAGTVTLLMCTGMLALLLAGCEQRMPSETFLATECTYRGTGEWRNRSERGICLARMPTTRDSNGHSDGGQCVSYASNVIHEQGQEVICTKQRWVRR